MRNPFRMGYHYFIGEYLKRPEQVRVHVADQAPAWKYFKRPRHITVGRKTSEHRMARAKFNPNSEVNDV